MRGRREKVFGPGRAVPLDRNAKTRVWIAALAKLRRTEPGRHWGEVTGKALEVLRALLWGYHNSRSGLCFPSYEAIAAKADCARSTVHRAIRMLEDAGIMTWVNRIRRAWDGERVRVLRTSNAYCFNVSACKSDLKPGTPRGSDSNKDRNARASPQARPGLRSALENLERRMAASKKRSEKAKEGSFD